MPQINPNLLELWLRSVGCSPVIHGASASGKPIIGITDPQGRHFVAKGEDTVTCLKALCIFRLISVPPDPPPPKVVQVDDDQWDRFMRGQGPWTE